MYVCVRACVYACMHMIYVCVCTYLPGYELNFWSGVYGTIIGECKAENLVYLFRANMNTLLALIVC